MPGPVSASTDESASAHQHRKSHQGLDPQLLYGSACHLPEESIPIPAGPGELALPMLFLSASLCVQRPEQQAGHWNSRSLCCPALVPRKQEIKGRGDECRHGAREKEGVVDPIVAQRSGFVPEQKASARGEPARTVGTSTQQSPRGGTGCGGRAGSGSGRAASCRTEPDTERFHLWCTPLTYLGTGSPHYVSTG